MNKEVKIANKKIGDKHPFFIITEVGTNHIGRYLRRINEDLICLESNWEKSNL